MGILRGGALAIVSVLLFVSILAAMLLLTMSWSLNYSNVQVEFKKVINETISKDVDINQVVEEQYPAMQVYCTQYSNYVLNFYERTLTIPCTDILAGKSGIVGIAIDKFISDVYYGQYDCNFWSCFTKETIPFFLVSAKAQTYWYSKFNLMLLVIAFLSIAAFLLAERKSNFFILFSILLVLISVLFLKLDWVIEMTGKTASGLLKVFFSKGYAVSVYGIIIGAVLLVIGLIMKLFRVGFKIQTIFAKKDEMDKDKVKKIVKEEVDKRKVSKKTVKKKK